MTGPTVAERFAGGAVLAASLALRVLAAFHAQVDTDEPQHLHVAWTWATGGVAYRDVFDNHAPAFHLLAAPLVGALGEWPEAIHVLRLAMLPLVALVLVATARLGTAIGGARVGWWSGVLLASAPVFFSPSVEVRPGVAWAAVWVLAVAVAVEGPLSWRRAGGVGLLLGGALAFSVKTLVFAPALGGAILLARGPGRATLSALAVAALAAAVVPIALGAWLASLGALGPMLEQTIGHNASTAVASVGLAFRVLGALGVLGVGAIGIRWVAGLEGASSPPTIVATTVVFLVALFPLYRPLASPQTALAVVPLVVPLLVAALFAVRDRFAARVPVAAFGVAIAVVQAVVLLVDRPLFEDHTGPQIELVREAIRATDPGEPFLDLKGEAIYRERPFFPVLETVTLARIASGAIVDDIPERVLATGTLAVKLDSPVFPPRARAFLNAGFVGVGRIRVAGAILEPAGMPAGVPQRFEVVVPASYAILADGRPATGLLDGTPLEGPRRLEPGTHVLVPDRPTHRHAILWSRAVERGFTVFR